MNIGWNQIPSALQTQFLQETGLASLPVLGIISESQWEALCDIVGEKQSTQLREEAEEGGSISTPALPSPKFSLSGDMSDIMLLIAELRAKLGELQLQSSTTGIQNDRETLDSMHKAEQIRIQKMIDNLDDARKAGTTKKVFGWIGAIAGIAGALVLTIVTSGAALPALVAATALTVGMGLEQAGVMDDVLEFVVMHTPILAGKIESGEVSLEKAKGYMNMAITLCLTAVKIATELICSIVMGVVSTAAGILAIATGIGAPLGVAIIGMGVGMSLISLGNAGVSALSAGAQIGSSIAGLVEGNYNFEASILKADSEENKAGLARLQTALAEIMDRFEEILKKMHEAIAKTGDMLSATEDTQHTIMNNMIS